MTEPGWHLVNCRGCGRASGVTASAKDRRCRHCGASETELGSVHADADSLRIAVAAANLPIGIRDDFRTALERRPDLASGSAVTAPDPLSLFKTAVVDGVIEKGRFLSISRRDGMSSEQAFGLLLEAEAEGLLMRLGEDVWQLLEP